jgi:hypothetical protein
VVGLLTGIAGVGGGFAIVPALVLLAGLPMQLASGTSLVLISTNSLVALAALGHWPAAQLPLLLPLVAGGLVGAVVGQRLAPHLPEVRLRQGFSALLIGSALLTGFEAWQRHQRPPSVHRAMANRQPLLPGSLVCSTGLAPAALRRRSTAAVQAAGSTTSSTPRTMAIPQWKG